MVCNERGGLRVEAVVVGDCMPCCVLRPPKGHFFLIKIPCRVVPQSVLNSSGERDRRLKKRSSPSRSSSGRNSSEEEQQAERLKFERPSPSSSSFPRNSPKSSRKKGRRRNGRRGQVRDPDILVLVVFLGCQLMSCLTSHSAQLPPSTKLRRNTSSGACLSSATNSPSFVTWVQCSRRPCCFVLVIGGSCGGTVVQSTEATCCV